MRNILLVDDDNTIISLLSDLINEQIKHVNLLIASTYKEALKHILNSDITIDVAVLDLNLPDANDGDLVDYSIKKQIPTIVLSGTQITDLQKDILEKDILDYIKKDGLNSMQYTVKEIQRVLDNYKTNVLIVDDSTVQISILKDMLQKLKLNVFTATNGIEALEILENEQREISLVLTDYNMPQMDGMELTLTIRKKYQKDILGIIVLSANDATDISTKFIKLGANDFINKPYTQIEVTTRVNSNLETLNLFQKTRDMANKDFMTGSYNRRFFFEKGEYLFQKAKNEHKDIAVAMFDIDKFKNINDTYGHDVGDVAICEVANILNDNLRKNDLIARFGGEEFCVILQNITLDEIKELFENIRAVFEKNIIHINDLKIQFTTSIGISYGIEDDLEKMIKVADDGLYHCKNNGRNQVAINIK